jgi:hypothetical protein
MKKFSLLQKVLLGILFVFLMIQFIRPKKNTGEAFGNEDILNAISVPEDVKNILIASCYDCHSNFTDHMWYENVQPIGWWIANHIKEGKDELNFSVFNSYTDKRKAHKLEEIAELVEEDAMPLSSYTLVHRQAKLNTEQKEKIISWANTEQQKLQKPE